jgi:RNA polymerase sigma-70 factor (ECF subfamily)
MVDTPLTRVTLLTRVKDTADADAWREFVQLYGPVIYGFARKQGLSDTDAADLMQEVLRTVAHHFGNGAYGSQCGTFCGWLFTITCNQIRNFLSNQKNRPPGTSDGGSQIEYFSNRHGAPDSDWDIEYQGQLAVTAIDRVKQEFDSLTWQAFWKAAVDGRPAQDVGLELKMTSGAVCVAKSRVLARLREEVRRLQVEGEAW